LQACLLAVVVSNNDKIYDFVSKEDNPEAQFTICGGGSSRRCCLLLTTPKISSSSQMRITELKRKKKRAEETRKA